VVDPAETGQPQHGSVIAASLGQLIERAVTALERGTFSYDRDQAMWNPILPWPWILDAG
jgi:hypothetical protein